MVALAALPLDSSTLDQARKLYDKAKFEEVVALLRDADPAALPLSARGEALFMLAVSELALGHDTLSQRAFVRLFTVAPNFELPPYTAPKVTAAAERAQKQVVIALETEYRDGRVTVCGEGLPKRAQVRVVFTSGAGEGAGDVRYEAPCFVAAPTSEVSGYFVIVLVDGNVRAVAGSRQEPVSIARGAQTFGEPRSVRPWYKHWLTWTIVGVAVVGGVTAGVVCASACGDRSPGRVRVALEIP